MSALATVEVQGGDPLVVEVILPAEQVVQVVEVVTGATGPQGPQGPPGESAVLGPLEWQTVFDSTVLPAGTQGLVLVENGTAGPVTITLPPSPVLGDALTIKDGLGNAGVYPVTVSGPIEDDPSLVVGSDWGWLSLTYNGAQWLQLVTAPRGLPGEVRGSGPASFLAVWDDEATALTSAHDSSGGGSGNLIGENLYGTLLGNPALLVGTRGAQHAIVGEIENDLAAHTIAYPTGITGLGRVAAGSDGNQAYAVYGQGELYAAEGVVYGTQGNAANHSGSGPDLGFPPAGAVVAVGVASSVVTAGGDCSYGLWVNNDTSDYADPAFYAGAYIQTFRKYGLRIEAQSSGAQWGSYVAGNGTGYVAEFHSTAEPDLGNAAVFGTDHTGAPMWVFTYGGSLLLERDLLVGGTLTLGTLPTNAANDAAAAGAGVPIGGVYRNGSVLQIRVA